MDNSPKPSFEGLAKPRGHLRMTETNREQQMAFKNFKVETDADGIALVTWDIPGRSMNVLDETTITELEEIVKQTSADAAVKGVVITSGKEAFSAGADLAMLEGMNHRYTELLKAKGEVADNQTLFDESRKSSLVV